MNDNGIIYPETLEYLNGFNDLKNNKIRELEKRAMAEHRPIVQRDTALFLMQIIRLNKPKTVLEIGTNFGYSAICMAIAANYSMKIDSIEFLEENVIEANKNFEKFNLKNINVHLIDALTFLSNLEKSYSVDFVFIDANKSQNQEYVEKVTPNLNTNGLIFVDNVLWKGQVTGHKEIHKRSRKSTKAIVSFNEWMMSNSLFDSQILPIGDGLLMSIKK